MKNKGFTLIELLGVIMILAILALITFPPIIEEIKKSKSEIKGTTKVLIIDAAKDYYADNMTNYEAVTGKTYCIDINTLIENNYLSKKIKDENLNDINTNKKIKMVYGNNKFEYEIVDECTDNIYDNDMLDSIIARETETIKNSITPATPDGVYYYDENGNLENNGYIINIGNDSKIRGNIMIHNNQFISGCISYGEKNYDYYKENITELDHRCSISRGENLVLNGDLTYKNNKNFSTFSYNEDGYISYKNNTSIQIYADELIPVDIDNKAYDIGMQIKTNNTSATNYIGFYEYDIDKNRIQAVNTMYITSNDISLTQDLKNGDEYVYLSDLSKWNKTATQTYQRGFIFWNYKDSTGYEYPPYTYSRNVWSNLYENSNIDTTNNRIKLNNAWNHGTIPAGTKLSQCNNGSNFNYIVAANKTLTTEWQEYAGRVDGVKTTGETPSKFFRGGTKYIKPATIFNYNKVSGTQNDYKDIYIKEVIR